MKKTAVHMPFQHLHKQNQEFVSCIYNHRLNSVRFQASESIAMASIMQQFTERKNFIEI